MNRDLDELISKYVDVVREFFPRLANHLGVTPPISNIDWACLDVPQQGSTPCGIDYFIHGYGVAMADDKRKVDFDLGENGEINGFDAYRLFEFAEENDLATPFVSGQEIVLAIEEAVDLGEVTYSGHILYYRTLTDSAQERDSFDPHGN